MYYLFENERKNKELVCFTVITFNPNMHLNFVLRVETALK